MNIELSFMKLFLLTSSHQVEIEIICDMSNNTEALVVQFLNLKKRKE